MRNKLFLIAAAFVFGCAGLSAQSSVNKDDIAFGDKEKLTYVVSYRAKLVPTLEAGEVVMKTTSTSLNGKPVFHVHALAKVFSQFKWFFDLEDVYQIWLDQNTLKPLKHSFRIKEGKHKAKCDYDYDWDKGEVSVFYHNLRKPKGRTANMKLSDNSFDALSLFYNLRSQDVHQFKVGEKNSLELVLDDTIRTVSFKFLGKEKKAIKKLGTFNTIKFSCSIAAGKDESFEDGSEFFIWLTDDKNKIPVYIESPVKVGSVRGILTKYENLKHPLSSKVK